MVTMAVCGVCATGAASAAPGRIIAASRMMSMNRRILAWPFARFCERKLRVDGGVAVSMTSTWFVVELGCISLG